MKPTIWLLALLCPLLIIAQPKPLSIGDTLPPALLKLLLSGQSRFINPLSFNNNYLILDFWATWCPACIKETPVLDSLQQQFAGRLSIIMVAAEPLQKVKAFLQKRKNIASSALTFLTSDTAFKNLFPHRYLPHQVWLSPQGRVEAITGSGYASLSAIQHWMAGHKPNLRLKADAPPINNAQPLFVNGNGAGESLLQFRSQWAGRLPGRGGSNGYFTGSGLTRYCFINRPVLSLYQTALGFPSGYVVLEMKNPSRILLPPDASEEQKDSCLYTYELTVPKNTAPEKWAALMVEDCNRYLNLNGRMEKRMVPCYAIRSSPQATTLLQQTIAHLPVDSNEAPPLNIQIRQMNLLITALNVGYSPGPQNPIIIDETGITSNINITLPYAALTDLTLLQQSLQQYGLQLVKTEKELNVLVLTEPGFTSSNKKP